jgi:hypothetical protein
MLLQISTPKYLTELDITIVSQEQSAGTWHNVL